MATTEQQWKPTLLLERYFTPTRFDKSGEVRKARNKNINLPILQMMYNGDELKPLKCMISGRLGWVDFSCLVTGTEKQRFDIDYNHIRQRQTGNNVAGSSVDKGKYSPSDIVRSYRLNEHKNIKLLYEFMTVMPLSQEMHCYVTQDSALGHITLLNFDKKYWPWILQSSENYNLFLEKYNINSKVTYDWLIEHLSNIDNRPIFERLDFVKNG